MITLFNSALLKKDFPLLDQHIVYLDSSSTSQKPRVVLDAITRFYTQHNANIHRGIYPLAQQATEEFEAARETVATFIGAEKEEIIFTSGTTEGINLLARSIGTTIQPGDEIVLSIMEHHSNLVPWQELARVTKAVLKFIPLTPQGRLHLDAAKKLISSKTKVVAVTHLSNVLGVLNPISEIMDLAKKAKAITVIDGAQSTPHLSINVKDLGCDFFVFSGHKMLASTGIGVVYGRKEIIEKLPPPKFGGGMITEVTTITSSWNDLPQRWEAGTPHLEGAVSLAAAIHYLEKIGMNTVWKHGQKLAAIARDRLSTIPEVRILGDYDSSEQGPVVSFVVEGIHVHDVAEICAREKVAVRAGHHCAMPLHQTLGVAGSVRASFYVYNTVEDVEALVLAVKKAIIFFKKKGFDSK